jgi:hypothetical protein
MAPRRQIDYVEAQSFIRSCSASVVFDSSCLVVYIGLGAAQWCTPLQAVIDASGPSPCAVVWCARAVLALLLCA